MNKMWVEWGVRNQILGILIKSVGDVQGKDNHTDAFFLFSFKLYSKVPSGRWSQSYT